MTQDQILTFAIIGTTVGLFIWNKWRFDIVSLLSLFAAVLAGIVPVDKAFSGFADPVVVTVACILVISAAISRSGFIDMALKIMNRFVEYKNLQIFVLVVMVMFLSAFMNNVGALAIFLPIAITFARKSGRKPSELLMPMSFASLIGGLVTLIGTPPNLMISNIRKDFLGESYSMFDFAPVGIAICLCSLLYLTFGWRLLPKDRRGQSLPEERFSIEDYVSEVSVDENSTLIDKTIRDVENFIEGDLSIIGLLRSGYRTLAPSGRLKVRSGDVLIVKSDPVALKNIVDTGKVSLIGSKETENTVFVSDDVGITEAVVMAGSELIGSTPSEMQLRRRFSVNLLAVRQSDRKKQTRLKNVRFEEGDLIVLQGNLDSMPETLAELGCLPLAERNLQLGRQKFIFLPVLIMAVAVLLAVTNILPLSISFLGGVILIALLKIMRPNEIYSAIDVSIIILLGALIPVTQAMQDTGGAELIAKFISEVTTGFPIWGVLASVLIATMLVTPFLNNAATVLLMAPIAANMAQNLDSDVDAFLMAVAIGASCDFLTPVGHQSNTLVMAPGGYKFTDYWRLGLPLSILVVIVGVPIIMWVWL
ncbi:MAG: SLC13 family permease [Micavibrio aeruginosavorus]|uniref:SLC13 family permease n=1 Tax=Micavibrio aeruginosavorus TaxID=349221 RepID=A0A2W5N282_9BACT|nr:MAG: SLC13 family permease [Micavibrio aeruginosavorus]